VALPVFLGEPGAGADAGLRGPNVDAGLRGPNVDDGVQHLAHVRLVSAMTALMAGSARSAEQLMAAGTELLAAVRDQLDAVRRGDAEPEQAWRESCRRAARLFADAG
jgi:hypothetical protein